MLKTMLNAWKVPDLRKKILFTLFVVIVFRIGSVIPVPFLNMDALQSLMEGLEEGSLFSYLNTISGDSFSRATLFAMSITPYINASIIMQLMTVVIPALERMTKEGEEGRKKMNAITRYLTVILGLLQGTAFYFWLKNNRSKNGISITMYNQGFEGVFSAIVIILTFTAGTALIMWLGEQINQKGVGNGISIILFAGIVSRMPTLIATLWGYLELAMRYPNGNISGLTLYTLQNWTLYIFVPLFIVLFLIVMWAIVFMNDAERRIPIQYAKRVVGRKMYGGQNSHIPVKVSGSGVMPIIFASSILSLPGTIRMLLGSNSPNWLNAISNALSPTGWVYPTVYFLLIIGFAYFYLTIQYNPVEMANNLRQSNGTIPGIRPGKPTAEYIQKVLSKITLIGSLFLGVIAIIPFLYSDLTGMHQTTFLGGTSVIILVGVALETVKQMESQLMMRHYRGFLD